MAIEDSLLSAHGYQLLPPATSQLMGDKSELEVSGIFHLFDSLLVGGCYNH